MTNTKLQIEELEFAGGSGMELDEYIESKEFQAEMEDLQMPEPIEE